MIVPIVLEQDMVIVEARVSQARKQGAKRIHIDIIDGLYADNVTVAPADLQAIDWTGLELDIHLLVDDPLEWLPECVALSPKRIFAQVERMGNIEYYLDALKGYKGVIAGLGLDLATELQKVDEKAIKAADAVLLMSVKAGWSGQVFDPRVLEKIKKVRRVYNNEIFVDGGINPGTYKQVIAAGATQAGANSAYWAGEFDAKHSDKLRG